RAARRRPRGRCWSERWSAASRARSLPSWPWRFSRTPRLVRAPPRARRPTPGRSSRSIESPRERLGELRTLGLILVLEEGGHVLREPRVAHPRRPRVEISLRVVEPPKAEISEWRGADPRRREVVDIGYAHRGARAFQRPEGRVREPALVAELEGGGNVARKLREKIREEGVVALQIRRQLVEHRSELRAERPRCFVEGGDHLGGPAEPGVMRDALPGLESEAKSVRYPGRPAASCLLGRDATAGVVDLDR